MRCPHCGGYVAEPGRDGPRPLTKCQRSIYEYVYYFTDALGYAPSFDEIAEFFDYRSTATVHEHLSNLQMKGWIVRDYNSSRAITCLVPLDKPTESSASPTPESSDEPAVR